MGAAANAVNSHHVALGDDNAIALKVQVGHGIAQLPVNIHASSHIMGAPDRVVLDVVIPVDHLHSRSAIAGVHSFDETQHDPLVLFVVVVATMREAVALSPLGRLAADGATQADRWHGAQLLHHAQHIQLAPPGSYFPTADAVDADRCADNVLARRCDSVE